MSFQRACGIADVASGAALAVDVDGTDVALVRDGDDWYAIDDVLHLRFGPARMHATVVICHKPRC